MAYKKFAEASLSLGDPLAYLRWADTYRAHAAINSELDRKIAHFGHALHNYKIAHARRKKDMRILKTFFEASEEFCELLSDEKAAKVACELIDLYSKRLSRLSSASGMYF